MSAAIPFSAPPPQSLTAGIPDPSTIQKQKDAYSKMLEEQLKQGQVVLEKQTQHQKEYLKSQAEQQKKQFIMQIDMEVRQQELALEAQKQEQMMALTTQAASQKAALEQQAMQLNMDYCQKKAEEEMQKQHYDLEKRQHEMQNKMAEEMAKFGNQAGGTLFGGLQAPSLNTVLGGLPNQTQVPQGTVIYHYGPNGELVPSEK